MSTNPETLQNDANVISFTKVDLPYGWLGNMAPSRILFEKKQYRTAEALFQCLRFEGHPEIQEEIRRASSPMACKMIAKKHKKLIQSHADLMGDKDIERMNLCLRLKVDQHPDIKMRLLKTGERVIMENCTKRSSTSGQFWGAS